MPALHGLHSADEIRDFLTKSANSKVLHEVGDNLNDAERRNVNPTEAQLDKIKDQIRQIRWQAPSAFSAIMLIVPITLLKISLNAFLIGLGIYFGEAYTHDLIPSYKAGNLAILIIFVVVSTLGVAMYYIPESFKRLEVAPLERYKRLKSINDVSNAARAQHTSQPQNPSGTPMRAQSTSTPTSQSLHSRNEDGRVQYTVPSTPTLELQRSENLAQRPGSPLHADTSALDRTESVDIVPRAPSSPQAKNADTSTDCGAVQAALADLIRCQEETLSASRRLQEAFDTPSNME